MADQAVVSLASFAATVIVGRTLGKEALGIYALGPFLFWLVAGVANALVWVPYTARACRLNEVDRRRYRASNTVMAAAMAVGLAALCVVGGLLAAPLQNWLSPFCLAMAPLSFLFLLREHVRRVFIADFHAAGLLLLDGPIAVLSVGSLLALSHNGRLTPSVALVATALAAGLCLPVVWRLTRGGGVTAEELSRDARSNWGFGRWMLVVAVAWLIGDGVLRWMLLGMHGMDALGVFSAAFSVVMLANPLILAMTSFARSWAARVQAADGTPGLFSHTVRLTLAGVVLAAAGMFLLAWAGDFMIQAFFGEQFADPRLVLLLAAAVCLQAVAIPVDAALTALELGKKMTQVSLLQLAAALLVGAPLVYAQGPMGIAWAMIARSAPLHIMAWDAMWKHYHSDVDLPKPSHARA